MNAQEAPDVAVSSVHAVAVYDPETGNVVHVHEVIVHEGADIPSDDDREEDALTAAAACGLERARMRTIHTSPDEIERDHRYRVDPERRALVDLGAVRRSGEHLSPLDR